MDSPSNQSNHSSECIIDDNSFFENVLQIPDIESKNSDVEFDTNKETCNSNSPVDGGEYINKKFNSKSLCDAESNNYLFTQEFIQITGNKNNEKLYPKNNEEEINETNIDMDENDRNKRNKTNKQEKNLLNTNSSENILDVDIPFIKEKFTVQKNKSEKIINEIVNGIEWSSLRNIFKNKENHSIIASKIFSHNIY